MEDMGGQRQVHKIKDGLKVLRKSINEWKVQEGLLHNSLFSFKQQEKGQNHLYDSIDHDEQEFTEADLKHETPAKGGDYMDSDLSLTIGKNKANRKKINTQQFLLQDEASMATEDTTQTGKNSERRGEGS